MLMTYFQHNSPRAGLSNSVSLQCFPSNIISYKHCKYPNTILDYQHIIELIVAYIAVTSKEKHDFLLARWCNCEQFRNAKTFMVIMSLKLLQQLIFPISFHVKVSLFCGSQLQVPIGNRNSGIPILSNVQIRIWLDKGSRLWTISENHINEQLP